MKTFIKSFNENFHPFVLMDYSAQNQTFIPIIQLTIPLTYINSFTPFGSINYSAHTDFYPVHLMNYCIRLDLQFNIDPQDPQTRIDR